MDEFEALHLARTRGLVPADALGDVDQLVADSLMLVSEHGCMLSPQGLERHEQLLNEWRESVDLEPLAKAYERFLAVNVPIKEACSAWQTTDGDAEALFLAVDSLAELLDRAKPALRRAAEAVPRFGGYGPRLEAAIAAAGEGDGRFLTDPTVDSFHGVWFECHEDFLTTLGRSREEEGSY